MILALASLTAALAGAPPASDSLLNAPGRRYAVRFDAEARNRPPVAVQWNKLAFGTASATRRVTRQSSAASQYTSGVPTPTKVRNRSQAER